MTMFQVQEAAARIGATVAGGDARIAGVSTDSRSINPGDLFVALRGDHFDGHEFLAAVKAAGAAAAMVDAAYAQRAQPPVADLPLIIVPDTRLGLGDLARWWRRVHADKKIVAVTGSNGKTTVKEMMAAICRAAADDASQVLATQGNLNNDIGMPLTLLRLRAEHRFVVLEMGMNHPGELRYLSGIARPDAVVINNAQAAHLEGLGTVEAVARAKGEIIEGVGENGTVILNADDAQLGLWLGLAAGRKVRTFGLGRADVTARWDAGPLSSRVEMRTPAGDVALTLPVPGEHNVRNALAATAATLAMGVPLATVGAALEGFAAVKGRLQKKPGRHGATLLDDTYNANPGSVRAGIDVLAGLPGRRVLVLGDMGELGETAVAAHAEMGRHAKARGIDAVFTLGELSRHTADAFGAGGRHFDEIDALAAAVGAAMDDATVVLVKGSRFMKMERVVERLSAAAV